jgi:hypothetical protein
MPLRCRAAAFAAATVLLTSAGCGAAVVDSVPIAPASGSLGVHRKVLAPTEDGADSRREVAEARRLLSSELSELDDAEVTKTLITIASDLRTSRPVLDEARSLLAKRRNGADDMLAALSDDPDFVSDARRPAPLGPLAEALAAMAETRAAPLLARHLNRPVHPPEDIERAALALETLATAAVQDELETFFSLNRATADEPAMVRAVLSVATTLLHLGGPGAEQMVARAADDPLTHPEVRRRLTSLEMTVAGTARSEQQTGSD